MKFCRIVLIFLIVLVLAGCANLDQSDSESNSSGGDSAYITNDYVFVLTSDYSTGSCSAIQMPNWKVDSDLALVHSDAMVRQYGEEIYVVNRLGQDNIMVLDSYDFGLQRQFSVGNGTNPQDIAFVDTNKAFISRYASNQLLIVDPSSDDGTELDTVNLSAYADDDGICEMAKMLVLNDKLYVAVQRLNCDSGSSPVGDSYLVIIDCLTNEIIGDIQLIGSNPYDLVYSAALDQILVAEVGNWTVTDGGIEAIDPNNDTSLGYIITETTLGGDCSILEIFSADKGYAIITDSGFNTKLVSFNPSTGELLNNSVYAPGGFTLTDIELDNNSRLYLTDRTDNNPGVRVFNAVNDQQLTSSPLDVGLPPNVLLAVYH